MIQAANLTNEITPTSNSAETQDESKAEERSDEESLAQGEVIGGGVRSNASSAVSKNERTVRGTASVDTARDATKGGEEEIEHADAAVVDGSVSHLSNTTGEVEERTGSRRNGGGGCKRQTGRSTEHSCVGRSTEACLLLCVCVFSRVLCHSPREWSVVKNKVVINVIRAYHTRSEVFTVLYVRVRAEVKIRRVSWGDSRGCQYMQQFSYVPGRYAGCPITHCNSAWRMNARMAIAVLIVAAGTILCVT